MREEGTREEGGKGRAMSEERDEQVHRWLQQFVEC
jgi:hypothetical protein